MLGACGYSGMFGWFGMALGIITHLAFLAVIILLAIWLFKAVFSNAKKS